MGEQVSAGEKSRVDSTEASAIRDLLQLAVKAVKARRLYLGASAVSERAEDDLFSRLAARIEEAGSLDLTVREFQLLHAEAVVYENLDRNDSLAFLLFRDGIRRLSFLPGLEKTDLRSLLQCLARSSPLGDRPDDLVTLFWEQDFKTIRYSAVEELASETEGPRLQEQLASGWTAAASSGRAVADPVTLKDLEQPVVHFPIAACQLSHQEAEALRAEVGHRGKEPSWTTVVELAVDLTLLETSEAERDALFESLLATLDRLLADGDVGAMAGSVEHLAGLADLVSGESEPVGRLKSRIVHSLAEPERLDRFLERVGQTRALRPADLSAHLNRLGAEALPALIPWMGRLPTPGLRRAVSEVVRTGGETAVGHLTRHLLAGEGADNAALWREGLHVLGRLPSDVVLPALEELLDASQTTGRREVVSLLGRFREERVEAICLGLLGDADEQIRGSALDTLVRRGRAGLAKPLLDRSLAAAGFDARSPVEKRRLFAGVAKLAGEEALAWFAELLGRTQRGWLAGRQDREVREAAAHGIRVVGTERARQLLRELAASRDRLTRAACLKELGGERGS